MAGKKSAKLKLKKLLTFRGGRPSKIDRPSKGKGSKYNRGKLKRADKDL
mgnify:FL=1